MSDLASTAPHSAHNSLATMRSTGQFGVIVFLASDVMLFAPFFAAYFLLRAGNQPWPPEGIELDVVRAAIFTGVLVASSFTLVASDRGSGAAPELQSLRDGLASTKLAVRARDEGSRGR